MIGGSNHIAVSLQSYKRSGLFALSQSDGDIVVAGLAVKRVGETGQTAVSSVQIIDHWRLLFTTGESDNRNTSKSSAHSINRDRSYQPISKNCCGGGSQIATVGVCDSHIWRSVIDGRTAIYNKTVGGYTPAAIEIIGIAHTSWVDILEIVQRQIQRQGSIELLVEVDFKTVDITEVGLHRFDTVDNRLHHIHRAVA